MEQIVLKKRFTGRRLLIATRHKKENAIAPILEKALGVECITIPNLDTDQFGTFSGEIERGDDPISTLRKKCLAALEKLDVDLVVGNEGSFGPHPTIGMIPADEEWMMLIDTRDKLEVVVRTISMETNFSGRSVESEAALLDFASQVKFPSHGIILRSGANDNRLIQKGIQDNAILIDSYKQLIDKYGQAFAETDMRALYNPTRMEVIRTLTEKLIISLESVCPQCETPGFNVVEAIPGLPCGQCGLKTRSTLRHRYQCQKCGAEEFQKFPNGKEQEDPMYCDFCNP